VQASLARGGGGNLNPNGRGLTEQVRGCPHRRKAGGLPFGGRSCTAKVPIGDAVVLKRFLFERRCTAKVPFGDVHVLQWFHFVRY
jgi:hypothetical protein